MSDLRERIKELIASGCGCDRMCIHTKDDCGCQNDADAAIALVRAEVLEEAAKVAEGMPINGHGNLAVEPYAAAKQVSDEIAAAIRALEEKA